jgi:polyhydroxyalkanoate synthesis regulator phasin
MAQRSKIERLDPRIREVVDQLIRDGRATIDEIVDRLREMIGDEAPSRTAVGNYAQRARKQMARYREAQEVAKVWIGKLDQEPDGDVGRLLSEMLRTVAFQTLGELGSRADGDVEASEVMLLARAIKDLASADKLSADREIRIRREIAKKVEDVVDETAKAQGMSEDQARFWREKVLGVVA